MDEIRFREALQDCGCSRETCEKCLEFARDSQRSQVLPILLKERAVILSEIHSGQEKLNTIDYLIYSIKKKI